MTSLVQQPVEVADLDTMDARADAATPPPWKPDYNLPFSAELVGVFAETEKRYVIHQDVTGRDDHDEDEESTLSIADAQFIASARTDLPRLTREVRRLRVIPANLSEQFLAERDKTDLRGRRASQPDYNAGYRMAMEDAARAARVTGGDDL